ncbi:hypothetical protein BC629DRAFT_1051002 [Irpex lacteus]|nr:hypothetical protein BC629DRAFT_1051002 [Irpex lacteus]
MSAGYDIGSMKVAAHKAVNYVAVHDGLATYAGPYAIAPVYKLPCEVLCMIFLSLRDIYAIDRRNYDHRWYRRTYIWLWQLKLVCSLWHKVAQDCPRLWSFVEASLPEHHFIIRKSKSVPLTVIYNPNPHGNVPPFLDEYRHILPRIQSLALMGASRWRPAFDGVTGLPALQELTIHQCASGHSDQGGPELEGHKQVGPPRLPDVFNSGSFPALEHLDILGYVGWDLKSSTIFSPNLRSLRLGSSGHGWPHKISLRHLLETLRRMPCLEHFMLLRVAPLSLESDEHSNIRVILPRLKYISICGTIQSSVFLLSRLKFPNDVNIDLTALKMPQDELVHIPTLFSILCDKLSGDMEFGPCRPVKTLVVQGCSTADCATQMFLHCLRTEYPYNTISYQKDAAFFRKALAYPINKQDPSTDAGVSWCPDRTLGDGVRVLFTPDDMAYIPPLWFPVLCEYWPLDDVETCALGAGNITIRDLRVVCPNTTTLFMETNRSGHCDTILGRLQSMVMPGKVRDDDDSSDDSDDLDFASTRHHMHLPYLNTLVLYPQSEEKLVEELGTGLDYLQKAGILTFQRVSVLRQTNNALSVEEMEAIQSLRRTFYPLILTLNSSEDHDYEMLDVEISDAL